MHRSCPVCESQQSHLAFTKQVRGVECTYHNCDSCQILFRGNFESGEQDELYDYQASWGSLTREQAYGELNARRYRELLTDFARVAPGKRLLDVGCGKGHFVYVAQQQGWESLGLEIYEAAVAAAKRFESPVEQIDFLGLENREFDVVTMFELVEHLEDPRRFIKKAHDVLGSDGLLFLTTPNARCLDARLAGPDWRAFDPEHLVLFSQKQLSDLVSDAGFRVLRATTRNVSPALLKRSVMRMVRRPKKSESGQEVAAKSRTQDQHTRKRLQSNPLTARLIDAANVGLGMSRLGSTIRILARKV